MPMASPKVKRSVKVDGREFAKRRVVLHARLLVLLRATYDRVFRQSKPPMVPHTSLLVPHKSLVVDTLISHLWMVGVRGEACSA